MVLWELEAPQAHYDRLAQEVVVEAHLALPAVLALRWLVARDDHLCSAVVATWEVGARRSRVVWAEQAALSVSAGREWQERQVREAPLRNNFVCAGGLEQELV